MSRAFKKDDQVRLSPTAQNLLQQRGGRHPNLDRIGIVVKDQFTNKNNVEFVNVQWPGRTTYARLDPQSLELVIEDKDDV
jgi:hypothetical protein